MVLQKLLSKELQGIASSSSQATSSQEQDSVDGQNDQPEASGIWRNGNAMQPGTVKAMSKGAWLPEERDCGKAFSCKWY